MMSRESSPKDEESRSIQEAISASQLYAKRGQRRFWWLSLSWVVVLAVISAYFFVALKDFAAQQENIATHLESIQIQHDHIVVQANELAQFRVYLEILRISIELLEDAYLSKLDDEDREQVALALAKGQIARQAWTTAEKKLFDEIERRPTQEKNAGDFYLSGIKALRDTKYDDAITYFTNAIQGDENYHQAYAGRAQTFYGLKRYPEALIDYTKAIDLAAPESSKYREYYGRRSTVNARLCDFEDAYEDAGELVRLDETYWYGYHARGFANFKLGNYKDARLDWEDAASRRPDPAGSRENIGLSYLQTEEWEKAAAHAEKINLIDASSDWNWLFLYIAADKLGHTEQAAEAKAKWEKLTESGGVGAIPFWLPSKFLSYLDLPAEPEGLCQD